MTDSLTVTAIVWSGLPGQEAGEYLSCTHQYFLDYLSLIGNGLVDVIYGAYNPR